MHLIVSETSFNISVLASGSTGNSLYIETDKRKVLVDAGLSGKKSRVYYHPLIARQKI